MPKRIIPMTEVKVRNAKPKGTTAYKIFDGDGLYLLITPSGGKLWQMKYNFKENGGNVKERKLSFGAYPAVSLGDARQRRGDARKMLANGVDPGAVKKDQKQADAVEFDTFEAVAREWHSKFAPSWSESHTETTLARMQNDLFPWLGNRPIKEIKAPELLAALRRVENRGALESARRLKIISGQVFRYAVATGRAERDPSGDLKGALAPPKEHHHAAITNPKEVAPLLRAMDGYGGSFIVCCALRLAPLLFVRPGELRHAEWSEIDLEEASWNIPGEKMKMGDPHLVPLSRQAVSILSELKQLTGTGKFVFPSERTAERPMSESTILAALRSLGYPKEKMTGHGFRAMARTILDEVLNVRPDLIETQLAHAVRDPNGRAYNRTSYLAERRKMMQKWSDYLDGLKQGAVVVPFVARG